MVTIEQVLATWRDNEKINQMLLDEIPAPGLAAVPLLKDGKPGRGRDVGRMFAHMFDARMYHMRRKEKDAAGEMPRFAKGETPSHGDLAMALKASGRAVELRLSGALEAGETIHQRHPLNFFAYLIAHDSHHRGQMLLALKQNGFRIDDEVKWDLWGAWFKD